MISGKLIIPFSGNVHVLLCFISSRINKIKSYEDEDDDLEPRKKRKRGEAKKSAASQMLADDEDDEEKDEEKDESSLVVLPPSDDEDDSGEEFKLKGSTRSRKRQCSRGSRSPRRSQTPADRKKAVQDKRNATKNKKLKDKFEKYFTSPTNTYSLLLPLCLLFLSKCSQGSETASQVGGGD